jgi:hypothetical protein
MPANNCLWLHENQCSLPTRPEPSQHHPEQLVSNPKPGLWMPPFQRGELLPEGEIFEEQVAAKTDGSSSQNKQEPRQAEHGASLTRKIRRNPRHLHLSDLAADRNFGEAQEYERLLSLRFSEDPDTKPKGGMVSDLEFQSHLDSRTKLNERLRELHQKLFGP